MQASQASINTHDVENSYILRLRCSASCRDMTPTLHLVSHIASSQRVGYWDKNAPHLFFRGNKLLPLYQLEKTLCGEHLLRLLQHTQTGCLNGCPSMAVELKSFSSSGLWQSFLEQTHQLNCQLCPSSSCWVVYKQIGPFKGQDSSIGLASRRSSTSACGFKKNMYSRVASHTLHGHC